MLGIVASPDIWRFQPHPEVWVLVAGLATMYTYAIKVIGPRAVPAGQTIVRRRQVGCFVAGLTLLWLASDWPLHDLSEEYLYSAHMSTPDSVPSRVKLPSTVRTNGPIVQPNDAMA